MWAEECTGTQHQALPTPIPHITCVSAQWAACAYWAGHDSEVYIADIKLSLKFIVHLP